MKLENLTKAELITLIRTRLFALPTENDMAIVRWNSLCNKARRMRSESIKKSSSTKNLDAHVLWEDAEKIQSRANKLFEKYWGASSTDLENAKN